MNRFFLGFLAVAALALMFEQAIAGNATVSQQFADNLAASDGSIFIIETYSTAAAPAAADSSMQPLPNNPGVEVAPDSSETGSAQPVEVEQDEMLVEEAE